MSRDIKVLPVEEYLAESARLSLSFEPDCQALITINDNSIINKSENIIQITETPQDNSHSVIGAGKIGESKHWLRAVFDASPDGILVIDEGKIVFVNSSCGRMLGYENPEELIGKGFSGILSPADAERAENFSAARLREEIYPAVYEVKARRKDGSPIELEATASASVIAEKLYTIAGIRSLSGRRKRAARLIKENETRQQSQKMEAIGTLTGGVAHDFNNLLTAIIGNTQLALCKLQADDPLRFRLTEIEKASNRAAVLTRQLLAFSRRQRLERRTINLNDTISEIMNLLQRIIGEDIEVSVNYASDLSKVFADPAQIQQVVMNLCVNAREALPDGGRFAIETSNVEIDESRRKEQYPYIKPGNYALIKISGGGMDEDTRARIFEPSFTTKGVGEKSGGLGLSMAYEIARQHGGFIDVDSEIGQGATYKIFLAADEKVVETERHGVQLSLFGGTETILVAEDEEALRDLAKDVLGRLGYTVLLAKNGEEAVEIYAENRDRIDMLLFDIVMPRMGGAEAYERIKDLGGDLPLIFITGYSSETTHSRFVRHNNSNGSLQAAVIQKPYNVPGLGHKVREVLDGRPKSAPLKKIAR